MLSKFKVRVVLCLLLVFLITSLFVMMTAKNMYIFKDLLKGDSDMKPFLIPADVELNRMNTRDIWDTYWTYINTIQVLCIQQMRMGSLRDGGKEVCVDTRFRPTDPCLVYSFGSQNRFDFEHDIMINFRCKIHTFDPSKGNRNWTVPSYVTFHNNGLGGRNVIHSGWELKTFGTILKALKHEHTTIDILKMDIESAEFDALPEMIKTGSLKNVKQICVEIHFGMGHIKEQDQLGVLRQLYEYGFRIFMRDRNTVIVRNHRTPLNEISLLNIHWT